MSLGPLLVRSGHAIKPSSARQCLSFDRDTTAPLAAQQPSKYVSPRRGEGRGARTLDILLRAKSRHQYPHALALHAKPSIKAVGALTSGFDRGRRHLQ